MPSVSRRHFFVWTGGALASARLLPGLAAGATGSLPQPYFASVNRALETLAKLGAPVAAADSKQIDALVRQNDSAAVDSAETILNRYTLANLSLGPDGSAHHEAVSPADPPITITINPEARVSVVLTGAMPPPALCGKPLPLRLKIVNQGFVTSRLEAEFVGDVPMGARLDFWPGPLKGVPEELRTLYIMLNAPGPIDLTLAFRSHNDAPDLGGRDRVHFLARCET